MKTLTQRGQYNKGGVGRWFRLFRDHRVFGRIGEGDRCIVDLGCGEGITLEELFHRFPDRNCLGIELDPEHARVSRSSRLPVVRGDICFMSLKTESVDCCLLMDVIEHLSNPDKVLGEIFRVLKPDGSLIVVFPNDKMFLLARLAFLKFREAFYDAGHVKQWVPRTMRAFLERKGFRVVASMSLPFFVWSLSLYHLIHVRKERKETVRK